MSRDTVHAIRIYMYEPGYCPSYQDIGARILPTLPGYMSQDTVHAIRIYQPGYCPRYQDI
jgi:hypothetical protein